MFLSGIRIAGTCVGHNKTHNVARKRFYPDSPQALWREFYYEIMTLGFDLRHPFLGDGAILWVNSERYLEDDNKTLFRIYYLIFTSMKGNFEIIANPEQEVGRTTPDKGFLRNIRVRDYSPSHHPVVNTDTFVMNQPSGIFPLRRDIKKKKNMF